MTVLFCGFNVWTDLQLGSAKFWLASEDILIKIRQLNTYETKFSWNRPLWKHSGDQAAYVDREKKQVNASGW